MSTTAELTYVGGATGLVFSARCGTGHGLTFDSGDGAIAVSPVETVLAALGACHGMDIVSILQKKRQVVTGYDIRLTCERRAQHPRAFTKIEVLHLVRGSNVSVAALEEAIRLTDTKYCSVHHSLDRGIDITSRWEILPA